jgi:hypothetical protein
VSQSDPSMDRQSNIRRPVIRGHSSWRLALNPAPPPPTGMRMGEEEGVIP